MGEPKWQFEGGAFHEDLPNGRSSGTLEVSPVSVHFKCEHAEMELPVAGLQAKLGGASNRMLFLNHADQSDWTFFTTDHAILKHPVFAKDKRMTGSRKRVSRTKWLSRASTFTFCCFSAWPLVGQRSDGSRGCEENPRGNGGKNW